MASLESLSNPLERLGVLPTTMNARFIGTSLTWSSLVQYFKNDVVLSGVDGGAYVCEITAVLGGSDPASAPAAWTKLAPNGIRNTTQIAIPTTAGSGTGPGTITLPAGATLTGLPAGSSWLVTIQGAYTNATTSVAGDVLTFEVTPNGTSAVVWTTDVQPIILASPGNTVDFGTSGVVTVGTGGTTITPTCSYGAVAFLGTAPSLTGRITYTRIS
jgi:hypothetical protein